MVRRSLLPVLLLVGAAGCGAPTAPSAAAQPDVNTSGAATLAVTTFAVRLYDTYAQYSYSAELQLAETSGESGVTLTDLALIADGGTSESECPPPVVHINAGETWNMRSLSYCAPYLVSRRAVERASFQATVTDDAGTVGHLRITVAVQ